MDTKTATKTEEPVCFVAMPYGRTDAEHEDLKAWYSLVVEVAVREAGYTPFLAVARNAPTSITEEILRHLATDGLAVFDLVGFDSDGFPNPNVMYELGIRHAFDLPAVIVAAKRENLPFDIQPQRAILETKTFAAAERTRTRLTEFLQHAAAGDYYKPMEGIRRAERIQAASTPAPEAMKEIASALTEIKSNLQVVSSQILGLNSERRDELLRQMHSKLSQSFPGLFPPYNLYELATKAREEKTTEQVLAEGAEAIRRSRELTERLEKKSEK